VLSKNKNCISVIDFQNYWRC